MSADAGVEISSRGSKGGGPGSNVVDGNPSTGGGKNLGGGGGSSGSRGGPHQYRGHQQHQQHPGQQQQDFGGGSGNFMQQDFSWNRNPMTGGMGPTDYNNFYYSGGPGYTPFSAGDMRDSIAAIWSRTSPSGEGVPAFSGGYGQFPHTSSGQFAATSAPAGAAGQFAANLTGHFATSDLGMFGAGGDFSAAAAAAAYGQQAPYGGGYNNYTQWGENGGPNSGSGGGRNGSATSYSYLGGMAQNEDMGRGGGYRERMADMQYGFEGMKISSVGGKKGESNGFQSSSSGSGQKKMSWASVASQPAKPQSHASKPKKPGVLPPPAIIPSAKSSIPPAVPSGQLSPTSSNDLNVPPTPASAPMAPPQGGLKVDQHAHAHGPMMPMGGGHVPPDMGHPNPPPQPPPQQMEPSHPPMSRPYPPHMREENGPPPRSQLSQGPRGSRSNGGGYGMPGPMRTAGHGGAGGMNSVGGSAGDMAGHSHPVLESLKSANEYNPKNFDLNPKNARFFVIKSFSEDDIHRSIKYEIWCSTDHGNKRLDAAFKERSGKGPIYLFFSVNGSGHFCGIAQMLSGVDYNTASNVWVQDKFKGQFKVKWIYVKDVPNGQLRQIRLENNENKPVTNSRDTQEVPYEKGKMVLRIIHSFKHQTSIFDDFYHYEKRQEEEGKKNAGMGIPGMNNGCHEDGNSRGTSYSGGSGRGGKRMHQPRH